MYLIRIDAIGIPRVARTVDSGMTWVAIVALGKLYHFPKAPEIEIG